MMSTEPIGRVWSSYGHTFVGSTEDTDSCLTCGGTWRLVPRQDDPGAGDYQANNGDAPDQCSGDTTMVHGYERHCDDPTCDPSEPCEHVTHNCNCVLCE